MPTIFLVVLYALPSLFLSLIAKRSGQIGLSKIIFVLGIAFAISAGLEPIGFQMMFENCRSNVESLICSAINLNIKLNDYYLVFLMGAVCTLGFKPWPTVHGGDDR